MLLWLIQGLVYLWTIITLPIYFLIYRPWTKTRRFYRKRAHRVEILKDEVTYRALSQTSPLRQKLMDENVNTMDKIFAFAAMKYGSRNCLGARKILEERQIPGVNGKIFKKLVMEPKYRWMNYQQVDQKSFSIGRYVVKLITF